MLQTALKYQQTSGLIQHSLNFTSYSVLQPSRADASFIYLLQVFPSPEKIFLCQFQLNQEADVNPTVNICQRSPVPKYPSSKRDGVSQVSHFLLLSPMLFLFPFMKGLKAEKGKGNVGKEKTPTDPISAQLSKQTVRANSLSSQIRQVKHSLAAKIYTCICQTLPSPVNDQFIHKMVTFACMNQALA